MATRHLPHSIAIGLLFGCFGFAGNWLRLELFFNVDFLFGSIFVIFALLRFGSLAGIIAGVLAATCTWLRWNHPWAIVIFVSEVLFLACLNHRRRRDLLTADLLFWLTIGAPMVWIFYHGVMGMTFQPTLLIALKQSINGILNTLLSTLAYTLFCAWRRRDQHLPSFRQFVFLSFVAFVVLPATAYLVWSLRRELNKERDELVTTVARLSNTASELVRQHLEEQMRTLQTVVLLTGDPQKTDWQILQQRIETIHHSAPSLQRLAVFDSRAALRARSPKPTPTTRNATFGNAADGVPFLSELQEKKRPIVTDTFRARIGAPVPLVAVVAPILRDGGIDGYCSGILETSLVHRTFETVINRRQLHFTLLDRSRRVIVSTREDLPMMSLFIRPEGVVSEVRAEVRHWVPSPEKGMSIMQRWGKSSFYRENRISAEFPWTVVVEGSATPMMHRLTAATIETLSHMLLLLLGTIGLSHLLSRSFLQTIRALESASNQIPERLRNRQRTEWPRSGIRELDHLSRNFQQIESALGNSFAHLQAMNETLEQRVAERTAALLRSEERFRSLFEGHQATMLIIDPETGTILDANQAAANFYGYDRPRLRQMRLDQLRVGTADLPRESDNHYTIVHRQAGGAERVMEVYSTILENDGGKVLFAILHDITERQRMEEELRHSKLEWERTFDAVPDLICTLDSQGRIQRMNRAMADRLHVNKEAVIGEHCFACVHGSASPHESCPLIRTVADLRPHSAEIAEDRLEGCFHITTTPVFDPDQRYLGTVHVARDISEEKKLQEQLQYLSLHDELTGLFNRRALDRAAEREWRRATRLPQSFSLLLLDIDHFKRYNDTWGHLQGDVCLREIAAAIQKSVLRTEDVAARYGGEEFAVVLPMTGADDAAQIAERIRSAVENHQVAHTDGVTSSRVTVSIGVATTIPFKDASLTLLFQMADQALYAAKSAGRNRVILHPDSARPSA